MEKKDTQNLTTSSVPDNDEFERKNRRMEFGQNQDMMRNQIRNCLVERRSAPISFGAYRCLFNQVGCQRYFQTQASMMGHALQCVNGMFRYCKEESCEFTGGRLTFNLRNFIQHAASHNVIPENTVGPIQINFLETDAILPVNGYFLKVLANLNFTDNGKTFNVLIAAVIQDVGIADKRVMIVPILHNDDEDEKSVNDVVEVELTLKGRHGFTIIPIAYHGFARANPFATSIRSYAFRNVTDFINASQQLDGVVTYSMLDIYQNAVKELSSSYPKTVSLEVNLRGFRCLVQGNSAFPHLPTALDWQYDLHILPEVQDTMDDGKEDHPSFESRIILPQMRGQSDFIVECVSPRPVVNAIMGGVMDHVRQMGQDVDDERATPISAIIFYPTVTMIRESSKEWQRRAKALNLDVFIFDCDFESVVHQLWKHGSNILIVTPTFWHKLLQSKRPNIVNLLTGQVKYVYFHHLQKYCFPDVLRNLEINCSKIPVGVIGTVRIGYVERMTPNIRLAINSEGSGRALFPAGWNLFILGTDPEDVISKMNIKWKQYDDIDAKVNQVVATIRENPPMRWLVLAVKGKESTGQWNDLTRKLEESFPARSLTVVFKEADVFANKNFWLPITSRQQSVLMGPYFLLDDDVKVQACDGVIIFSSPIHRADIVRIGRIFGVQKPCICFKGMNL